MLFGLSLIFGLTGTASIPEIGTRLAEVIAEPNSRLAVTVATVFVMTGLGYKIASVPFHMWGPDVYEGAPTPVTTLLAAASKAMGFVAVFRVFVFPLDSVYEEWELILGIIALASMTVGNLAAISQNDIAVSYTHLTLPTKA